MCSVVFIFSHFSGFLTRWFIIFAGNNAGGDDETDRLSVSSTLLLYNFCVWKLSNLQVNFQLVFLCQNSSWKYVLLQARSKSSRSSSVPAGARRHTFQAPKPPSGKLFLGKLLCHCPLGIGQASCCWQSIVQVQLLYDASLCKRF